MQHPSHTTSASSIGQAIEPVRADANSFNFRRKAIASAVRIVLGASLLASGSGFAADDPSISDLQAENTRLRQELQALKDSLQGQPTQPEAQQAATPASAETEKKTAEAPPSDTLDAVVVTSRNKEEIAQDVPLPISVIGGKTLERDNVTTVNELVKKVPNLGVFGSNPRQTSIAIRGIGKNSANDTMEPSVGVIVDGVVSSYVGQSWNDFVDLDRIEVIRGPQGTLLGKNTTLGVINISTKAPSFTPGYTYEARVGEENELTGKFSGTGPIIDNLLAYRGSFFLTKKDGVLDNTWQSGPETWNETNRIGGRLQFLATPTDNLSARVILDQTQSVENGNKSLLLNNGPAFFEDGPARTTTFASRLSRSYFNNADGTPYRPKFGNNEIEDAKARPQRTKQSGVSTEIKWNIDDAYTLTSLTAKRQQHFDIKNGGVTHFDIGDGGQQLWNDQISQEIRLSFSGNEHYDYQVGLYYLDAEVYSDDPTAYGADAGAFNASNSQYNALSAPQYRGLLRDSQDGVYRSYVLNPTTKSLAAFGQANWYVTDKTTLTLGLRNTYEKKEGRNRRELDRAGKVLTDNAKAADYGLTLSAGYLGGGPATTADDRAWDAAKALYRSATGTSYDWIKGKTIKDNSVAWLISPSYKWNKDLMFYTSAAYGEKSGAVEFNTDSSSPNYGRPQNVDPEKALDFELGFKSMLFERKVLLNANLYYTKVTDYQGNLTVPDSTQPSGLRTYLGNIPGVRARGVEFETAFAATPNLSLNLSGAYNDAEYTEFTTTAPDLSTNRLVDYSGRQLHGAPKVTLNYGFDFNKPLGAGYAAHIYLTNSYRSGTYLASNQSKYTWQEGYTLTDGGIGITRNNGKYELSVVGKNLLDKDYATGKGSYSGTSAITEQPGYGRTVGIVFRAKL